MARTRKTLLSSGVKLITREMPDTESSTIGIWVKTGSRSESSRVSGISHFIEHMLFKGTKKRSSLDISKEIESVGGYLNAFTSRECTCYYAKVLNKDISLAVDLLTDMFLNSVFDPGEIEKERQVVLQEIRMVDDTPDDLVHDLFSKRLWRGDQAGAPVLGTEESVSSFTRQDVLDYYNDHYRLGKVFISAAGGFKHAKLERLVNSALKKIKSGAKKKALKQPTAVRGVTLLKKDLEQVHLCLGVPAISQRDPDRYALYLLNNILGGGMSSRLFQEVREKRGLAYSVYSYISLMEDSGSLVVYAGTGRESFSEVTRLILKEFASLRKGVGRRELIDAKEQIKGGMLLGLETSDSRMMKIARDEISFGKVQSIKSLVKGIDSVRGADIKRLAKKLLLNSKVTMVAVGGAAKKDLPVSLNRIVNVVVDKGVKGKGRG